MTATTTRMIGRKNTFQQLPHTNDELIRRRAQELNEKRGKKDGHALDDWLQAEAEIRNAIPIVRLAA